MEEDIPRDTSCCHFFLSVSPIPFLTKYALTLLLSTIGSSIYTPAFDAIQKQWGVSETVALLPLTTYVLALALGPIIAAPLSESTLR